MFNSQAHIDNTLERNMDVKKIMDSWTLKKGLKFWIKLSFALINYNLLISFIKNKKGYPVVQIVINRVITSFNSSQKLFNITNFYDTTLNIKQKWFLLNPLSKPLLPSFSSLYNSYKWYIPLTFTTKSKLNFDFENRPYWLKPNDLECNLFNDNLKLSILVKNICKVTFKSKF